MKIIENKKGSKIYIPEIDGLRCLAIIPVILNHLNADILKSGFLGVDIFFVISGYVITKSVLSNNFINFFEFAKSFFERRFKRLFPALFVYVISIVFIICLFNPYPNVSIRTGFFSLIGLSNLYLFKYSTDYFAQASYLNPFVNTWSLSLEEQFYVIFPAIIFFSGFFRKRVERTLFLTQLVLSISVLSLILFLTNYYVNPSFSYFLIPTRFWEIGIGVLTYILHKEYKIKFIENSLFKLSIFQPLGIIFLILTFFSPNQFAQYKTFFVVLVTSYFLLSFDNNSLVNKILSNNLLVYIGKLSYSLYLWHWGIISLSYWIYGKNSNPLLVLILIFLTSFISYKYIETPFRIKKWKILFLGTFKIVISLVIFAFLLIYNLGEARKFRYNLISLVTGNDVDPESFYLSQRVTGTTINRKNCHGIFIPKYDSFESVINKCTYSYFENNSNKPIRIFLAGDSHSYSLRNLIANLANKYQTFFTSISGSMFPSNIYWHNSISKPFISDVVVGITNDYMNYILSNARSEDIVFISNRIVTLYSKPINIEQKKLYDDALFFDKNGKSISRSKSLNLWFRDLESFIYKAKERNISIIYILPVPEFRESAQACLFSANRKNCSEIDKNFLRKNYSSIYSNFKNLENKFNNLILIDPFQTFCNEDKCFMSGNDFDNNAKVSYYSDNNHLSLTGSRKLYKKIDIVLKNLISRGNDFEFVPFLEKEDIRF